jgi:8-amino-3,8-dideoxy-alpha-D-manno-octulosonate transaminase
MTTSREALAINGGAPVRERPYDAERGVNYLSEAEELRAVTEVMQSRSLFRYYGPDFQHRTEAFEERFKEMLGVRYAVGVSSGTAALHCGLVGLGVEDGDEVIVPAVTFIATPGAVVMARAVPVFAEVDDTLCLSPESFEASITARTKAVIPVHLSNVACDMDRIMAIAHKHNIKVLEDAAQAIGVSYNGRQVGTFGDAGAFSLQLSKNITTGEGGVIVTDDWNVYDRAVRFQDQGGQFTTSHGDVREHTSGDPFYGTNLRMTEIAGALAHAQLERLESITTTMRDRAHAIRRRLSDLPVDWRRIPDPAGEGGNVTMFFQRAETAVQFAEALRAEGIPAGRVYGGRPVYHNPAVLERRTAWSKGCPFNCTEHPTDRTYHIGMCPRSEDLLARSLSIQLGALMTDQDADDVVRAVRKVAEHLL